MFVLFVSAYVCALGLLSLSVFAFHRSCVLYVSLLDCCLLCLCGCLLVCLCAVVSALLCVCVLGFRGRTNAPAIALVGSLCFLAAGSSAGEDDGGHVEGHVVCREVFNQPEEGSPRLMNFVSFISTIISIAA